MSITLKIIVQNSPRCVEVLTYIRDNIATIRPMGVRIEVEYLRPGELRESLKTLQRRGITRLPVLVTPDDKHVIGKDRIIELFRRNATQMKVSRGVSGGTASGGKTRAATKDVHDLQMRELYAGVRRDKKAGFIVDKDDDEGPAGEGIDTEKMQREMRRRGLSQPADGDDSEDSDAEADPDGDRFDNVHRNMMDEMEPAEDLLTDYMMHHMKN